MAFLARRDAWNPPGRGNEKSEGTAFMKSSNMV